MATVAAPIDATSTAAWKALEAHQEKLEADGIDLKAWFAADADRVNKLSFDAGDLHFDLSKNLVTDETVKLLCDLAREVKLEERQSPGQSPGPHRLPGLRPHRPNRLPRRPRPNRNERVRVRAGHDRASPAPPKRAHRACACRLPARPVPWCRHSGQPIARTSEPHPHPQPSAKQLGKARFVA